MPGATEAGENTGDRNVPWADQSLVDDQRQSRTMAIHIKLYTTSKKMKTINHGFIWVVGNWQNIWTSLIRIQTISALEVLTLILRLNPFTMELICRPLPSVK